MYGEFAPFWKLSAEAYKQQLIYYPVSDPDNKTVVELDGDNEYPITSTNKWEDYEGFVRAWYGTGEDEYIDSMTFTIEFENKKDTMDDYSKELFETMYEHNNKSYFNLDIHEETDVYYDHDQ